MKPNKKISGAVLAIAITVLFIGCDKNKPYETMMAESGVHFISTKRVIPYYIQDNATTTFTIELGTTDVSSTDRTVTFKVNTPTGAVEGTHYTLASHGTTVTIPAGQSKASIVVHGIFGPYGDGTRIDTLQFVLTEPSIKAVLNDTLNLVLQRYCDVDLEQFTGIYKIQDYADGTPDGGPYTVEVTPGTSTGDNSGFVTVAGLWGIDVPTIRVNLDWSDPANFTSTVVRNTNWFNYPPYGAVTINPVSGGTFSSCDNTITLSYEPTVSAGSFGPYTSVLSK